MKNCHVWAFDIFLILRSNGNLSFLRRFSRCEGDLRISTLSDARQSLCLGVWHFWFFFFFRFNGNFFLANFLIETGYRTIFVQHEESRGWKKNLSQKRAFLRWREFPIAVFPTSVTTERGRYSASSLTGEISYRIIFFWLEENRGQQKFLTK